MNLGQQERELMRRKSASERVSEREGFYRKKGKDPHPQDKIQHLDFAEEPRPLYYKTPPCIFYHKSVRSKAVLGP